MISKKELMKPQLLFSFDGLNVEIDLQETV